MPHEAIPGAMETLFECISEEEDPRVRAVLAPFLFTYIHPFRDGNGRMARFMMNVLLADCGYRWTIIPFAKKREYLACLEQASCEEDIRPYGGFLKELVMRVHVARPTVSVGSD